MGKVSVAGKVDPEILEALERLKEREQLKSISQTVEFALMQYFDNEYTDTKTVTLGYLEEKKEGNGIDPVLFRTLEEIELKLKELRRELMKRTASREAME
jgi:hypothetical protein